jgi:streptomycin 6-kinase
VTLLPPGLPVLTTLGRVPEAQPWLAALPDLITEVAARWRLTLSPPLAGGSCSWVAPATLPDGTTAIVKIGWPHREMAGEPVALRHWAGRGAVRLLATDPDRHALLLQRCDPGTELGAWPGDQLAAGCAVLAGLHRAGVPAGLETLGDVAAEWAGLIEERMDRLRPPYDAGLVATGADLLRSLPGTAGRTVLLHGDFNPGNVLRHGDGWRAIDPKPMTGDPAYDPCPLVEQVTDARPRAERYAAAAAALGLDAGRVRAWAVARTVEAALWSASRGDVDAGAAGLRAARELAP